MQQKHEMRARKAKMAISYITFGTLMVIWALIWLVYLTLPREVSGLVYIATGIVLSGIAVVVIGIMVGAIGKEANVDDPEMQLPTTRPSPATKKTDPSMPAGTNMIDEQQIESQAH